MRMFQRTGRNSVNVQSTGNVTVTDGGYANSGIDYTSTTSTVSGSRINIRNGNLSIVSDGKTLHIDSKHDLSIYLNGVKIN